MTGTEAHIHLVDDALTLRADPRGAAPSPLAGVSVAELETMLDDIRWFSSLSLGQVLAASQAHQRRARRLIDNAARDGA